MDVMAAALNGGKGGTVEEATALLWNMHGPWKVWVILGGVGLLATLGMVGYYYKTRDRAAAPAA